MQYLIENLNVLYTDSHGNRDMILQDINLKIEDNDFIGLLGQSGSGKTQLANALARLNQFYGGEVKADKQLFTIENKIVDLSISAHLMEFKSDYISYIFQEAYSYFNPVKKIKNHFEAYNSNEAKITNMMGLLRLDDHESILNSYPHQLSGGQLQRIAIIKTLVKRPSIIIADEIDSALDHTNASLVMDLLMKVRSEFGFALVWITHDQQRAKEICNKIWFIENGKVKFDGDAVSFVPIQIGRSKRERQKFNDPLIEVVSVSKSYQRAGKWWKQLNYNVLKDVHISINRKEIVGLVGASGSGKSTIGKIMTGLESFDSGSIWITGIEHKKLDPSKDIIYLFQDAYSALNPEHTVQEILMEALSMAKSKLTLTELVQMGQLEMTILAKKSNQISGGMRQRLALIRALALNPLLLILDESLNAMDEVLKKEIIKLLVDHQTKTGMSILLISHQLPEVTALADKVYKIEEGSVLIYDLHT